ncbi:MAG: peptidylprolyl isomerase [Anaerolineales bacterium]|nr:peptidylprolyl isomerase [Anaerolineales bacterium]
MTLPKQLSFLPSTTLRACFLLSFLFYACSPATASSPTTVLPTPKLIFPTEAPSCTTLNVKPTPGPEAPSLFPPETANDHARGAANPSVTITTYVDYQDSRSAFFVDVTNQLLAEYPEDVRVVYRLFPLAGMLDKSTLAAQAAEAAREQGKFWEMNDLLFKQHANWVNLPPEDFGQWLSAQVVGLGLKPDQFESDLHSEGIVNRVQSYVDDGNQIGIPGTPLILVNGQIYTGPRDHGSFNDIIALILLGKRQFTSCPPFSVDASKQYLATLHTEKGDVVIELFADKAPATVNSFIFLAQNGWYDNITFHRVIPALFAQTGDPSGTGKGNPGYYVITEIDPALKFDRPGVVAIVNSGTNTSGSQFFITYAPTMQFNGQYTIFGQVLSGMDVLASLTPRDAEPGTESPPGNKLLNVEIVEK